MSDRRLRPTQCDPYYPTRPGQSAVYYYKKDPPAPAASPVRGRPAAEQAPPPPEEPVVPGTGWHITCTSAVDVDGDVRRRELVVTPPGQVHPQ